jgi:predicted transposase/invertase (TIGR01784 family)
VKKAVAKLMTLSEDDRARMLAESRDKMRWDIESGKRAAKEEGRTEERQAFARKLLGRNRPIEEIMEDTGLSKEEIQSLLH